MRSHRLLILLLPALFGLFGASPAQAQQPDEHRPYLELPFPGGRSYEVTCGYGCYQHKGNMSYGVDFDLPEGAPVTAAAAGEVMAITWEIGLPRNLNLGDALIVYIDHGDGWFTRYIHLSALTVRVGDRVELGQIIGYSGKTGASGAHLHFELRRGQALSSPSVPINELFGGAEPVEGVRYRSNNAALPDEALPVVPTATNSQVPTAPVVTSTVPTSGATLPAPPPTQEASTPAGDGTAAALPTAPSVDPASFHRVPYVMQGLSLTPSEFRAGDEVTASFVIFNPTTERLLLTSLGIAPVGGADSARGLAFKHAIVLEPGEQYTFTQKMVVNEPGALTVSPFALGVNNEWIPIAGNIAPTTVQVTAAPIYLPMLFGPPPPPIQTGPSYGISDRDK